jgi:sugar/nucleoside kinase (ribokinase family)
MLDESIFQGTRLCVVGNICRDVKTAPLHADDRLFHDGETSTDSIVETVGGGGANSALFAAGLGAEVGFAGKVGDDPLGTRLEQALLQRGIASFVRRGPQVQTGSSLVLSYTNGCRHFISHQPNNYTFSFSDIDLALLQGGGHLLRADVWFSESMLATGNAQLLHAARERGLATSLDLNWDPWWDSASEDGDCPNCRRSENGTIPLEQARKEAIRRVLPLVDLVHGNVRELNRFADSTELATTLQRLTAWGAGAVVLHMGAQGAGYYSGGELIVEPCAPAPRSVNATGSGDLLSTCMMLLHHRHEIPVAEKLRLANRIVADYIAGKREFLSPL